MKRTASKLLPLMGIFLSLSVMSADVESAYYESIASRKTGVYEQNGTVYFHSLFVRGPTDDDSTCRRRAMHSVRGMMVEWVTKHASAYEALPKTIRKIDSFCSLYDKDGALVSISLHVSGRGFTDEKDEAYAYGLAVPLKELLREANKGVPGKTEADILARWRRICARELNGDAANVFLEKIGCGNLGVVPQEFTDKISAECAFLDGWEASSRVVGMLKTTGLIDQQPEDLWTEGLNLIAELKEGKIRLADAGVRLHDALLETPGSPVLWCYLGAYLKEKRLYRLSAVAYKNSFSLSSNIGLLPLLKSSVENLAVVYRVLHRDAQAEGFDLLFMGLGK